MLIYVTIKIHITKVHAPENNAFRKHIIYVLVHSKYHAWSKEGVKGIYCQM